MMLLPAKVFIDGIDVRKYKLEDLYAKIGYVPQKGVFFSGTLNTNIKYGAPEATEIEVKKSLKFLKPKNLLKNLKINLSTDCPRRR